MLLMNYLQFICRPGLNKYSFDNFTVHVGQSVIAALKLIRQLLMIDSKQVENCCLQIMNVHGVLHHVVPIFIRLTETRTRLYAGTRHPDREAARMMVAAVICRRQLTLRIVRPAKFTTPDN